MKSLYIYLFNKRDWSNYIPVAEQYLQKYGLNIKESERKMFQEAIDLHANVPKR